MPAGEITRPDWPKYATQWTFNLFYAILPANEIERDASRGRSLTCCYQYAGDVTLICNAGM